MSARDGDRFFSGIIDFDSESTGISGIQIAATIVEHGASLTIRPIRRTGRGSLGLPKVRMGDARGGGTFAGAYIPDSPPLPSNLKYATGTIIRQMSPNCNFVYPVRISSLSDSFSEGRIEGNGAQQEVYHVNGQWILNGAVTLTWNGTPVTLSAPSPNDQETYAGLTKIYDANGLLTAATQHIDCEGILDTDADEASKLASIVAAGVAPITHLKVKTAYFKKDEDDSTGGQIVIQWALQDSVDNVETPKNTQVTDANKLRDRRTLARVFPVGAPPVTPSPPSGLKLVTYDDVKLNDQFYARIWLYGRTDSKDDVENPRHFDEVDANKIRDVERRGLIFPPGSPPVTPTPTAGLKLITYSDFKLNDDVSLRVWSFGRTDSSDDIINPQTHTETDPNVLRSTASTAVLWDGITPPSTPTFSGFKLVMVKDRKINDAVFARIYQWGLNNSIDDVTKPETVSTRSSSTADVDVSAGVVVSGSSPQTLADSLKAAFFAQTNAYSMRVRKLTDARAKVTYTLINPGLLMIATTVSTARWVAARINAGGTGVEVYVAEAITRGSGKTWVRIAPTLVHVPIRYITLRRLIQRSMAPIVLDYPNDVTNVNAASFLGIGAGKVMYKGFAGSVRFDLPTPLSVWTGWNFISDINGMFSLEGMRRDAWFMCTSSPTPGSWTDVSTLTGANLNGILPATSDFTSLFLF